METLKRKLRVSLIMQRKLIKQGAGGCTLYLPRKWIIKKGLKGGDSVNIIEANNTLIIKSSIVERKEQIIEVSKDNKDDIGNILTHAYRTGVDKITLNKISKTQIQDIKKITEKLLLGFEITKKSENSCTIENISEPTEDKYETILRRAFLIVQETLNVLEEGFESGFTELNGVKELKESQDKYILFCKRLLAKEKTEKDSLAGWELLVFLMHIEHSLYYLYAYLAENKIKKADEGKVLVLKLKEYFDLYYNAYYHKNLNNVHKINDLKKEYQFGKLLRSLEKSTGSDAVMHMYLREAFRLIQIGTSPILEVCL